MRSKNYLVEVEVTGVEMALLLEKVRLVPVCQLQRSRQIFLHTFLFLNSLPQTVKLQGERADLQFKHLSNLTKGTFVSSSSIF